MNPCKLSAPELIPEEHLAIVVYHQFSHVRVVSPRISLPLKHTNIAVFDGPVEFSHKCVFPQRRSLTLKHTNIEVFDSPVEPTQIQTQLVQYDATVFINVSRRRNKPTLKAPELNVPPLNTPTLETLTLDGTDLDAPPLNAPTLDAPTSALTGVSSVLPPRVI